ncbi:MAG TPA: PhnD/SsuA/transferrin family substrate-binding protein, partial [Trueperaceae bacterium]
MLKRILAGLLVLGLALPIAFAQDDGETPDHLVLGMVPSVEAGVIVDNLNPIAKMLSDRLGIPVEPFVATSYVGVVEALG